MAATVRADAAPATRAPAAVLWLVVGAVAYVLLGLLGRQTIVEGHTLSLVWPSAGMAMLMVGLAGRRRWLLALALVAVGVYAVSVLGGMSTGATLVFEVSTLLQTLVGALVLQALAPHLLGAGGEDRAVRIGDFWTVLAACTVGSAVGAATGAAGMLLVDEGWSWADTVVWWGRNVAGGLAVLATGLLVVRVLPAVLARGPRATAARRAWLREVGRERLVELTLLVVVTLILYLSVFYWYGALPVAFPLLVPTVWAGLRFSPLTTALHSLTVAVLVVVFTMREDGPFAIAGSWHEEALVSQLYISLVFCLGMLLSLARADRLALTRVLFHERAESERQALMMAAVIESMHDGLTLVDGSGAVLMRNEAGASIARTEDGRDTSVSQYVMTDASGRVLEHDDMPQIRVFRSDGVVLQDVVLRFNDGSPSRTVSISARQLPAEDGGPSDRAVLIYHDVTEDRAQRSALESFAGVVAHDLMGPLAIIDGWSELLELDLEVGGSIGRDDGLAKVQHIQNASASMRQLIGDLLDSSTSREQALRSTVVDLQDLVGALARTRTTASLGDPPRIEVGQLPAVYADAAMVRQVFDNLVNNAIKYVAPGERPEITITGRTLGDMVEVSVADHGIGIPAAEREQIFEPFHRVSTDVEYAGHGIGLSVCLKIVDRHGGRITARAPKDGRGTRIVFTLPSAVGHTAHAPRPDSD